MAELNLLDDPALARKLKWKEHKRSEAIRLTEMRRAQRAKRGMQIVAKKRSDLIFLAAPASDQLRFWTNFRRSYREVDVTEELNRALQGFENENIRLEQERRIAALEERVHRAKIQARSAARYTYYHRSPYSYASRYVHSRGHVDHHRHGLRSAANIFPTHEAPLRQSLSQTRATHTFRITTRDPITQRDIVHSTSYRTATDPGNLDGHRAVTRSSSHRTIVHTPIATYKFHHNRTTRRTANLSRTTARSARSGARSPSPQPQTNLKQARFTPPVRTPNFFAAELRC